MGRGIAAMAAGAALAWPMLAPLPAVAAGGQAQMHTPCPGCPPMVAVPAGRSVMGDDAGFTEAEKPAVEVEVARPYLLSRTEVTFDQWAACAAEGACRPNPDDHGWGRGRRPVVNVTWDEARAFAAWVGRKARLACRLPTEAEWEYAARAGTSTQFWWGDDAGVGHANCRDCRGIDPHEVYGSQPAASYPANPFGLFDMNGNVWEWTADCWTPSHAAPPPAGACTERVIKGGSWYYYSAMSRPAARAANDGRNHSYNIGLRVLCEIP